MSATIQKVKAKTKAVEAGTAVVAIEAVMLEFADGKLKLDAEYAKLAGADKAVKKSEALVLAHCDVAQKASEERSYPVGDYVLDVGAKGSAATKFDNVAIKKALGPVLFDKLAQFSVTDLKKYLTGDQFDKVVTYENVNKRRIVIRKAEPGA